MSTLETRAMKGSALDASEGDIAIGIPVETDTAHTFSVGDVIYESALDDWALARADSESTFLNGLALVVADLSANTFQAVPKNQSHDIAWTHGLGGSHGDALYLSATTAGDMITPNPPASGFAVRLGYIKSATVIRWEPGSIA
jgi:hypothetical protein